MPTYRAGDYVKVEFRDDHTSESEWMWVKVDRCDDGQRIVFGKLDNQPAVVFRDKLKLGSEVAISYDLVREYRKASDFR